MVRSLFHFFFFISTYIYDPDTHVFKINKAEYSMRNGNSLLLQPGPYHPTLQ